LKVLIINGSPHKSGTTYTALSEAARVFEAEGIEAEIVHIGHLPLTGCKACGACSKLGKCVIDDEVNAVSAKFGEADGIVIGSPVYYAAPNGTLLAFLDRLFHSASFDKRYKVGAGVVAQEEADAPHHLMYSTNTSQFPRCR